MRKLPPATLLVIEPDGRRHETTYWRTEFGRRPEHEGWSARDWQDAILSSLRTAVDRRMVADVPVGCLLSGGLDSSLIVGLLAEAGVRDLLTFSIGFESHGGIEGDEFRYSDVIAERFATDHHRIRIPSDRLLPALGGAIGAMSEPMVSHDVVAFYLLSQEVAKHVKVVQSGQGADEVFAGYHWYPPMLEPGAASDGGVLAYSQAFFDRPTRRWPTSWPPPTAAPTTPSGTFVAGHFARPGASTPIDRALRIDTEIMLVDDPVKRVDNMTMAWGLEARVPFLDHELVELAAACPPELKVAQGGKGVLKEAARRVIPAEVIDRPEGLLPGAGAHPPRGPAARHGPRRAHRPRGQAAGPVRTGLRRSAARRSQRRADPAARQQAVAARPARAVAAEPRDRPVSARRANVPTADPATTHPPPTSGAGARTPRAGPCRTGSSAAGTGTTPSRRRAGRSLPEHLVASMARDVVVDMGWGRVLFGQTFRSAAAIVAQLRDEAEGRRDICLYARDPHVLVARRRRSCSSTRRTPTGSGCTGPCPAATRCAASSCGRSPPASDADAINRIYVRCGMVPAPADVLWANQQARHITYLVAEDVRTGDARRHRDRHRPRPGLRRPRGRDARCGPWPSTRRRRSPASARRWCGPWSSGSTPVAAPTSTCR